LLPPSTNVPPPTNATIRPQGMQNFAPVPAGGMSSSFTPNVSPQPPGAFPAPASAVPISSNPVPVSGTTAQTRPIYPPPGGNALPQRMVAPAVAGVPTIQPSSGQPTLAQTPPSGWSAPGAGTASTASSTSSGPSATGASASPSASTIGTSAA